MPQHQDAVQFRAARRPMTKSTPRRCNSCASFPGFNKPSQANAEAFDRAVAEVSDSRPPAADIAAYQCAGARPRDRGREGEGAVEGRDSGGSIHGHDAF